jgi:AcrR family transcriptional regulator
MNTTKKRIRDKALALFNSQGLSQVTLRTIAKELGMSQGNLNYHYKKRAEIIEVLYEDLVTALSAEFVKFETAELSMNLLFEVNTAVMKVFFNYRFMMLDFVQVMRTHPKISAHYQTLTVHRKEQFMSLVQRLIAADYLRQADFKGEYEEVWERVQMLGDFWLSSAYINSKLEESQVAHYARLMGGVWYPYFTPKAKKSYLQFQKS